MSAIKHWRWQRYSAFALIILIPWTVYDLTAMYHFGGFASQTIIEWFSQPQKSISLLLTLTVALYHAKLGVEVIAEDYVPNPSRQCFIIALCNVVIVVCWLLGCFALLSILSF